ncbi:MAG: cytochrome c biogenesis protein CcdA [bacterium]|nr:cytochrome c biogenesis protein CcdA [bacterium]MDZ4295934.1 cytochrome c biogenesis protein CcdA [Patescibacteria group bacterium]
MGDSSRLNVVLTSLLVGLGGVLALGLMWFFFLGPTAPVGFGWYLFSFAAGLTMIVLPCTLPLAFVIVPLSMGKSAIKGLGIAIAFGLGVALMLSLYGVAAALVGKVAIGTIGAPLETVKNWLYVVAGAFAYLFALGEIGLLTLRMPSYTGAAPAFIQKQQDYLKAFFLGLFLGNVGVGCPHPATPVILTRIAASGEVFYGWLLFFVHAAGRVLPLLLLALLAILGVNALSWIVARKDKVERATGWGMVFVAGFILTLGLFTHDWWVYSGQHTLLESFTQEERFLRVIAERTGAEAVHAHGIPTGTGLFGMPLWLGNWFLVLLWIAPLWWYYYRKKQELRIADQG